VKVRLFLALAAIAVCATRVAAQPRGTGQPGTFRSEVRFLGYAFQNFFHSADPRNEQDITALGSEYRAAYRARTRPVEVFGHLNVLHYNEETLEDSYGGRAGFAYDGKMNDVRAYVDRTLNRPSFEVGNVFAPADTTTFALEHAIRVSPQWELAAEGRQQVQSFESPQRLPTTLQRNNHFSAIGGSVRYRGLGWRYTPSIGFRSGNFVVRNPQESYLDRTWFVQMAAIPRDRLYFSLRYGDRNRDYSIRDQRSSNFGRTEDRGQWELVADYKSQGRLGYTLYYAREDVNSSRA
jgi:hypothetical protein